MSMPSEPNLTYEPKGEVPSTGEEQIDPDSLASGFLKNVDPADRPVIERYIKDWDAGVTRKFQSIHDQYRPYKDLGVDAPTVQRAVNLMNMLNSDPRNFYNLLRNELGEMVEPQPQTPPAPVAEPELPEWAAGLDPQFVSRFDRVEQMLTTLAQRYMDMNQATQQQQEDAQLDSYLKGLTQKYGEFDEQYVVAKMYQGMDGDAAVKAYQEFVSGVIEKHGGRRPAPVVLGNGAHPVGAKPPSEMSSGEVKALVAQMLQAGQES
jgi:hypothetical protein